MALKRLLYILILCATAVGAECETKGVQSKFRKVPADSVYQSATIKFDLGSAAYLPVRHKGDVQTYDFAASVRLFQKFFPTVEAGYAQARLTDYYGNNLYRGYGGFMRLGADYSVLKKYKGENHLLVGLRVATSLQGYGYPALTRTGDYWQSDKASYSRLFGADAWGEIVAGVQVHIYKGLNMGWFVRYKILMTRGKTLDGIVRPAYILGYGQRDDTAFGWNYYIGWTF